MKTSVQELRKYVAPEFVFGVDARLLAGRYANNWGLKKVLLVSDPGVNRAGWTHEIAESLEKEGVSVVQFLGISPNPRDYEVMAGVEVYRQEGCDSLVAIGGGSVLDAAKGIAIVASNHKHILEFEGVDRVTVPMPPLICIPTTAGTSADVSQFAIINNSTEKVKIAIISKALVPDVALIDPKTLISVDPFLTACTGMDALVHAIEAYVSNASSPLTDLHALEAIRLLQNHLAASILEPLNLDHRSAVMLGSLEAGLAFSNASLGCVHALAHTLGGQLDLPHGECNALLLPQVVDYNFVVAADRFVKIGDILQCPLGGMDASAARRRLREHLTQMRTDLGIKGSLAKRGLSSADISLLASKAIKDPCNATNPRPPNKRDLEVILEESL